MLQVRLYHLLWLFGAAVSILGVLFLFTPETVTIQMQDGSSKVIFTRPSYISPILVIIGGVILFSGLLAYIRSVDKLPPDIRKRYIRDE